jgi:hypothetical protein
MPEGIPAFVLMAVLINPEFRSRPDRSCDASPQQGAGDVLVASCGGDYAAAGNNATGALLLPYGERRRRYFRMAASEFGINTDFRQCFSFTFRVNRWFFIEAWYSQYNDEGSSIFAKDLLQRNVHPRLNCGLQVYGGDGFVALFDLAFSSRAFARLFCASVSSGLSRRAS